MAPGRLRLYLLLVTRKKLQEEVNKDVYANSHHTQMQHAGSSSTS